MNATEFLLDTLKYYTEDTNRRCTGKEEDGNGNLIIICRYDPHNVGKENVSDGCAIGRFMTPENKKLGDQLDMSTISTLYIFNPQLLPDWMLQLDKSFLSSVQNFHDMSYNWNEKGLTDTGKRNLERIIISNKLDIEQFKQYLNETSTQD